MGNRKCEDRYARIATPIDANMRYSLAKMILDAQSAEISRLKIHLGIAIDALKKFPNHANAGDALAMIGGGPMKPSGKGETT